MIQIHRIFRFIPRRYRVYVFIIFIICLPIAFVYFNRPLDLHVEKVDNHIHFFDLYDDDDIPLKCPIDIQFNITNRRHLAIILSGKLLPFIWKNFRALLCSGIDAYVMLDEVFIINSSLRVDDLKLHTNRSIRSYSHRFLYVSNQALAKFGVSYMKKLPSVQYTAWDRAVVWLYHRIDLTHVWLLEYDVQWFHVRNMTYLFDLFAEDETDLLTDNLLSSNSAWMHWPTNKSDIFPKAYWTGTFSPLVRWSRLLLQHHYRYMQLIHINRLKYEIDINYRFQEFIMGTIATTENLPIKMFSQNNSFVGIELHNINNAAILSCLRDGKYILHPVKYDSILTKYRTEDLVRMMAMNTLHLTNTTLLSKEIIEQ